MIIADIPAGRLLDCLVACALNPAEKTYQYGEEWGIRWHGVPPPYSTEWAAGGEIMGLLINSGYSIMKHDAASPVVIMNAFGRFEGTTALESACRATVTLRLGKDVLVPFARPVEAPVKNGWVSRQGIWLFRDE